MSEIPINLKSENPSSNNQKSLQTKISKLIKDIDHWDKEMVLSIYHHKKLSKYVFLWKVISYFGDPRLWGLVVVVFGLYGIITVDFSLLILFTTGFFQSFIIYYIIKKSIKRPRPFKQISEINRLDKTGHGYSFPSGHCHHSTILIGLIFILWLPWWALPLVLLYNLLIAFSRIFLGCHFPSDTIVGTLEAYLELIIFWFGTKMLYLNIYENLMTLILN